MKGRHAFQQGEDVTWRCCRVRSGREEQLIHFLYPPSHLLYRRDLVDDYIGQHGSDVFGADITQT